MQRDLANHGPRGSHVVAVGQGDGATAAAFCARLGVDAICLGDPEREAYARFALGRGTWFGLVVKPFLTDFRKAWRRLRRADLHAAARKESDPLQLGGMAAIDGDGVVRFLHRSSFPGDHPPLARALDSLGLPG